MNFVSHFKKSGVLFFNRISGLQFFYFLQGHTITGIIYSTIELIYKEDLIVCYHSILLHASDSATECLSCKAFLPLNKLCLVSGFKISGC